MSDDTPSLLDEWAAEQRAASDAAAQPWRMPATCPSCGATEPSGHQLSTDHGYDPTTLTISGYPQGQHPIYGRRCVAQHHAVSHILYCVLALRRGEGGDTRQLLARCITRAQDLGLDGQQIADDYATRRLSPACLAQRHLACDGDDCDCGCRAHHRAAQDLETP